MYKNITYYIFSVKFYKRFFSQYSGLSGFEFARDSNFAGILNREKSASQFLIGKSGFPFGIEISNSNSDGPLYVEFNHRELNGMCLQFLLFLVYEPSHNNILFVSLMLHVSLAERIIEHI